MFTESVGFLSAIAAIILYGLSHFKLGDIHQQYVFFPVDEVRILLIFNVVGGCILFMAAAIDWRFYRTPILTALSYATGLFILVDNTFLTSVFVSTQWAKYQHSPVNVTTLTLYEGAALQETAHNFSVMDDVRGLWYAAVATTIIAFACYITTKPNKVWTTTKDVEKHTNGLSNIITKKRRHKRLSGI